MLLNRLLDIGEEENVFLAEESWQDLLDLPATAQILEEEPDSDAIIEIKDLGWALHLNQPVEVWLLLTDRYSSQKILSEKALVWRENACKVVHPVESDFLLALTELLSLSLSSELFCEICPQEGEPIYLEERIERLAGFLKPLLPLEDSILEICCGNGMATQALKRLGRHPLSMDSDRCDLCLALKSELLDPGRSFVLDARLLPSIFPIRSFRAVVGFMVGLIDGFNWPIWKDILLKASSLAEERILFTVYTQKEAEMIAKALGEVGWKGKVIDNRDSKGIYDQWAYFAISDR